MNDNPDAKAEATEIWNRLVQKAGSHGVNFSDISAEISGFREKAKTHRDGAIDGLETDGFRKAGKRLEVALELLSKTEEGGVGNLLADHRAELLGLKAHCHGSAGGTFRDAREWDKAIEQYDAGYALQLAVHGNSDTYTELQRLIMRIIKVPECLQANHPGEVEGLNVRKELRSIRSRLEKPLSTVDFNSEQSAWALADVAEVRILLGQPRKRAWREFAFENRSQNAYEANYKVFAALEEAGVTIPGVVESKDWLAERLQTLYDFSVQK